MIRRPCGTSGRSGPSAHHPERLEAELAGGAVDDGRGFLLFHELKGRGVFELFHPDDFGDAIVECFPQASGGGQRHHVQVRAYGDEVVPAGERLEFVEVLGEERLRLLRGDLGVEVERGEHPDDQRPGAVVLDHRLESLLDEGGELVDGERPAQQDVL